MQSVTQTIQKVFTYDSTGTAEIGRRTQSEQESESGARSEGLIFDTRNIYKNVLNSIAGETKPSKGEKSSEYNEGQRTEQGSGDSSSKSANVNNSTNSQTSN